MDRRTDPNLHSFAQKFEQTPKQAKRSGYKNIYGVCISVGAVHTALSGIAGLQSSINPRIGLAALSLLYASAFVAAFASPTVLKLIGTKYSMLCGYIGILFYILANFYPSWFTLLPSALITGLTSRPMWAGLQSHSAETAVTMALALNKKPHYLIGKFSGIFLAGFVSSNILGNLVSSLILFPYKHYVEDTNTYNDNLSFNQSSGYNEAAEDIPGSVCDINGSDIDQKLILILTSIYVVFVAAGIIVLLVFVDRLPTENNFFSTKKKFNVYFRKPLTDIFSVLKSVKMCLMAPMMTLWGLEISLSLGTFTEVYISSCFGIYQVGFTLMVLGVTSAVMCRVCGKMYKYIPRLFIVQFGVLLMIAILVFLLVWERVPSYAVIFSFAVGWGISDAIVCTNACVAGILFPKKSEVAYSVNMLWSGVGYTLGYAMGELVPLKGQLVIVLVLAVLSSVCFFFVDFVYLRQSPLVSGKKQKVDLSERTGHPNTTNATNPMVNGETGPSSCSKQSTATGSHSSCVMYNPIQLNSDHRPVADNPLFELCSELEASTINPAPALSSIFNHQRGEIEASPELLNHSQPQSTSYPPSPLIPAFQLEKNNCVMIHEYSKSNLLKSIKYSQSYMYALDNAVEAEYMYMYSHV